MNCTAETKLESIKTIIFILLLYYIIIYIIIYYITLFKTIIFFKEFIYTLKY